MFFSDALRKFLSSRPRALIAVALVLSACAAQSPTDQAPDRYMIFFEKNSAVLQASEPVVEAIAKQAMSHPDKKFVIAGFSDEAETKNIDALRTNSVVGQLVKLGVPVDRLLPKPGGSGAPVVIGDTLVREGSYRVEVFYQP
ncbi:hypothetical protein HYN69_02790 [Gemmobacter aquarius]|uniref:OmpA-like domain-containing protein n=1 Tax=Paragemmobacter aquarius TaxID=2169400 RepID=A0A2S0UID2_9RHOB|nr:hypothetical protein [Gemmobacter aquarius]AWB47574.1 hypothetical protein HYN69_02790 [Gemmobacter aquarius]